MTEWIDFSIYALLIVAIWFVWPAWNDRFTAAVVSDRNPEWVATHQETVSKLERVWHPGVYYAWGAVSLGLLLTFQAGVWPGDLTSWADGGSRWEALKDLNSTLLLPGILYFAATGVLFRRSLKQLVPLAERRRASLEPRTLDDFVPRGFQIAVYTLVGGVLVAWLAVGILQVYSTAIFWARFAFLAGLTPAIAYVVQLGVNRRPGTLDRILGPGFRVREIRYAFVTHVIPPIVGVVRLYEEVTATQPMDLQRLLHLVVPAFVAAWVFSLSSQTRRITTAVCAVLALTVPGSAAAQTPADTDVHQILVERVETNHQGIGIVVGIIEPSGRRVVTYGRASAGDTRPLDGDTVFELASVTKAFTSLLLADAVQRREVALVDPVWKYLPNTVRVPERGGRAITLHDLATHTSGLPREPLNLQPKEPWNPFADYSVEQLYQFLSGYQLTRDIGSEFEYSNLGAGLLGHVLARRAGIDYEGLVRARITDPLGMTSTGVTLSPGLRARLAVGHNRLLEPASNWDSPTLAGAGALRSTANDMLTFLAAALGYRESPLSAAFGAMAANRRQTGSPVLEIGLGWGILKERGTEIFFVNGRSGGYRTWLGYEPMTRRGVVVLTNADSAVPPDDIGRHVLNPAFPLVRTFPTAPAVRTETQLTAAMIDRYVGRYQLAPAVVLTVTRYGKRVFSQLTGEPPFEMFAENEKAFFLKAAELQLVFETSPNGRATAVTLQANGAEQRAPRIEGAPVMPVEVTLDSAAVEAVLGRYQIAPNVMLTVSRNGNQLFAQITGQPPAEIFALGPREFFYKVVDAQLTFEGEEQGRVTAVVLHQSGRELRAPRIE